MTGIAGGAAALFCGYLLGSILFGVLISRAFHGPDIRTVGSLNPGFTNVLRQVGAKAGALTLAGDVAKGAIGVGVARWILPMAFPVDPLLLGALAAAGALVGNFWPLYHGFRGGKGVATALGAFLVLATVATCCAVITWAVTLALFRYMSLASILGALALPIYLTWINPAPGSGVALMIVSWIVAAGIVLRHQSNVGRLLRKTEPKFNLRRS